MDKKTALETFGLPSGASPDEIERRYVQVQAFLEGTGPANMESLRLQLLAEIEEAMNIMESSETKSQIKKSPIEQSAQEQRTQPEHWQQGGEIVFESVSGKHKLDDVAPVLQTLDNISDLTIKGHYMALTMKRMLLNAKMKVGWSDEIEQRTAVEFLFHNVWDYKLSTFSSAKMVDTDGFQHGGESREFEVLTNGKTKKLSLNGPEDELEDHSKSRGWILFEELPTGVLPQRVIVSVHIHEPGHTSGWVKNTEVLEFFIKSCSTKPLVL